MVVSTVTEVICAAAGGSENSNRTSIIPIWRLETPIQFFNTLFVQQVTPAIVKILQETENNRFTIIDESYP